MTLERTTYNDNPVSAKRNPAGAEFGRIMGIRPDPDSGDGSSVHP